MKPYKRCGCRGSDGKQLGTRCTALKTSGHGSWCVKVDLPKGRDGKRIRRTLSGFPTKAEATAAAAEAITKHRRGSAGSGRATCADWFEEWLASRSPDSGVLSLGGRLKPSTWDSYASHVRLYLIPHLGHIPLRDLETADIRRMLQAISREGSSGRAIKRGTQERILATARSSLKAAVRAGRLQHNPAAEWSTDPDPDDAFQAQPLEQEELKRLLGAMKGHRLGGYYAMLATTGLRRGEGLGLRWQDVYVNGTRGGRLVVRQAVRERKGVVSFGTPKTKNSRDRVVYFGETVVAELERVRSEQRVEREAWGADYQDNDLIFCREDGSPHRPAVATDTFRRALKRLGIRHARLHDLRHGVASMWLNSGRDMATLSKMLGHSTVSFTIDTYSHLSEAVQEEAAPVLDAFISGF